MTCICQHNNLILTQCDQRLKVTLVTPRGRAARHTSALFTLCSGHLIEKFSSFKTQPEKNTHTHTHTKCDSSLRAEWHRQTSHTQEKHKWVKPSPPRFCHLKHHSLRQQWFMKIKIFYKRCKYWQLAPLDNNRVEFKPLFFTDVSDRPTWLNGTSVVVISGTALLETSHYCTCLLARWTHLKTQIHKDKTNIITIIIFYIYMWCWCKKLSSWCSVCFDFTVADHTRQNSSRMWQELR